MYHVTDYELRRIEDGCCPVAYDLTWATTSLSITATLIASLNTGTFGTTARPVLILAAVCGGVIAILTGVRWWRNRNASKDVVAEIRERRVDPDV